MKAFEINHSNSMAILAYHSLDDSGSVLSTSPQAFGEQMRILSELGVDVVALCDVVQRKNMASPSRPIVAITFDDGFRNVYEHGLPILQRHQFLATVFLVTDYCGSFNSWPSQPVGIMRQPLLDWKQIREMSQAGISFGSHTRTHPDLTTIPAHEAEDEIVGSKKAIEDAIGSPVDSFAYPYGLYNDTAKQLAKAQFNLACSTALGFVQSNSDLFGLERMDMYYLRHPLLFQSLFTRVMGTYIGFRRTARDVRQWLAS